MKINVVRTEEGRGLPLPKRQTAGAAGMDLYAAIPDQITLAPGAFALVPTGLILEIPEGYEGQVRPRSGLAMKHGVTVLNAPGTIDSDYRGEVGVLLINHGSQAFEIRRGERIAQLVISSLSTVDLVEGIGYQETARGASGFGSTGVETEPAEDPKDETVLARSRNRKTKSSTVDATSEGAA